MWKWASLAAGMVFISLMLLAALRIRLRRRSNMRIDDEELNQWFRRRK
ncbi:hypothetical protein GCM10011579_001940 [Streptomyces albiflavescens]|uniref:Uncharacterized protein n=1 Tax=Streptomyces albiflavescens TaxID=1623582 RepID=A0A917XQB4_9ACTN|nr:hypothetical protein [Streptomyces albiflavescens]GGN48839.1 hypothetical protein GCM10011579_001940 [Streptomyces albiflavescens]